MTAIIDLEGQKFGLWLVLRRGGLKGSVRLWVCRCDCGAEREVRGGNLRHGKSTGCGCDRTRPVAHGQASRRIGRTRSYNAWRAMRRRCTNPTERDRDRYAGVECDSRWSDFRNFFADMGECPEGMTLDRIRGERGYRPGNCRWVTRAAQNRNTRRNRWVTLDGVSMVLKDAAQLIGVSDTAIYQAMKRRGISSQEAVIAAQTKRR